MRYLISLTLILALLQISDLKLLNKESIAFTTNANEQRSRIQLSEAYGKLPLRFEVNRGQASPQVRFISRGKGYSLLLTESEALLAIDSSESTLLRMRLVGANLKPHITGLDELPGKSNYLIGNDPGKWHINVPTYARVEYKDVYPGIDLIYYGNQRKLEYDFRVAPGIDPGIIKLEFAGAQAIDIDDRGNLILQTAAGAIVQNRPRIYQEVNGLRQEIAGSFLLQETGRSDTEAQGRIDRNVLRRNIRTSDVGRGDVGRRTDRRRTYIERRASNVERQSAIRSETTVAFQVGDYDPTKTLVIDPQLSFSNTFGGTTGDQGFSGDLGLGIAVDSAGNGYITGTTFSSNFPVSAPFQSTNKGGFDLFVTKLDPATNTMIYSTYIGGSGNDQALAIALDSSNNAYLTGNTTSTDFPLKDPVQGASRGNGDGFVMKLNSAGNALVYSTYLGGSGVDQGTGIAVGSDGSAFVTGFTNSSNFPTANAVQSALGGRFDAFVVKLNSAGTSLVYSTYLGGSDDENNRLPFISTAPSGAIAVDPSGNAYVTGYTHSNNFPLKDALQSTKGESFFGSDAFVTKINATGSALVYSTFLGGGGNDQGLAIAVDSSGSVYVTGSTGSENFPTVNALQSTPGRGTCSPGVGIAPCTDAFVARLNSAGSALLFSTYLGGSGNDAGHGIAIDQAGNAHLIGTTNSPNLQTLGAFQGSGGGGLIKSSNRAVSWSISSNGLAATVINALVIDGSNSSRLYTATRDGVFKSSDNGSSWSAINTGIGNRPVFSLAIDPANPAILYGGSSFGALFKSTDSGANWSRLRIGTSFTQTNGLAINSTTPNTLYAGTSDGFFISTDGGANWSASNTGLTSQSIISLAVEPKSPTTIYVGTNLFTGGGVFKSTNAGASWSRIAGLGGEVNAFAFDPVNANTVYAVASPDLGGSGGGLYRSTDNGNSWSQFVRTGFGVLSIAIDPANPATIYLGTDLFSGLGVLKSTNGGANFSASGLTTQRVRALVIDRNNPATVYAGTTGNNDAFIARLSPTGVLEQASYLGGTGTDEGRAVALASSGNPYLSGFTHSSDFPKKTDAETRGHGDAGRKKEWESGRMGESDAGTRGHGDAETKTSNIERRTSNVNPQSENPPIGVDALEVEISPDDVADVFLALVQGAFGCPIIPLSGLPDGNLGLFYNRTITASGGTPPHRFTLASGQLPPGLTLTPSGVVSGLPTQTGIFKFTIMVTDANNCTGSRDYQITIGKAIIDSPPLSQNDGKAGDPVSTAGGELYEFFDEDIYLRGPLPIVFSRFYSSGLSSEGQVASALGNNWMHNYDLRLELSGSTAKIVYHLGQPIRFNLSGTNWALASKDSLIYQLIQSGATFKFYDPSSKLIHTFNADAGGRLERIEDRNGNALTLSYNGALLSRVADGLGRTLDFTYTSGKLTRVQDASGRSISFSHTGDNLTGFTDTAGERTIYSYTAAGSRTGLLISTTRPRGNIPFTQTYDTSGRVASQTDGAGNRTTFAYDSPIAGQTTVTDPLSATSVFQHQNGRNMVQQIDQAGNPVIMSYDSNNRRSSVKDRTGNTTSFAYHAPSGLIESITYTDGTKLTCSYSATSSGGFTFYDLTQVTYPDNTQERFEYDGAGNVITRIDRAGQRWQFTYNSRGQFLTITLPSGGVVTSTYNADGTRASIQFPGAQASVYSYDSLKRPTLISHADGRSRAYVWDARDQIVSVTDEREATTTASSDKNGRLLSVTDPTGAAVTLAYNETDNLARITDALNQALTFGYDQLNRVKSITYPDGGQITFGYDSTGNLTTITDGEGKVWNVGFDKDGRETSLTTPLGERTLLARNAIGQVTQVTTPLGNQVVFAYDSMNRLISVTDPLSGTSQIAYDARGDISQFMLANGISASYARNALGRITEVTDPNGNKWKYSFDAAGRLASATDPLGNVVSYSRNSRGRISQVDMPGGTLTVTTDGLGRVTRNAFSGGTVLDYTYDLRGLLTAATGVSLQYDRRGDIVASNGLQFERDAVGRIAKLTLAAGKTISYSYDRRDLLTEVRDFAGGVTSFTYDAAGRLARITRPNGVTTQYSYDAEGNITSIVESAAASSLATTSFVRDKKGLVAQASRNVPLSPTIEQLATIQGTRAFDAASQIVGFTYDNLGRRTGDGARTYLWDLASRLMKLTEGSETTEFTYDAFSLMLSETRGAITRQFVWNYAFALPSISVVRQGGSDLRYYVHTPDGELLYSIDAADRSRRFYHYDEMGNTLFLTNDQGAITDSYAYAPYGTLLASTGSSDNPFTYEGRYGVMRLGASGLYYVRQRVFDSVNACFISRDPIARIEPRLINPYQYGC